MSIRHLESPTQASLAENPSLDFEATAVSTFDTYSRCAGFAGFFSAKFLGQSIRRDVDNGHRFYFLRDGPIAAALGVGEQSADRKIDGS